MKNPFLSAWLSGANTMLSAARSLAAAEAGRQRASLIRALTPRVPKPPRRPKRTTRS